MRRLVQTGYVSGVAALLALACMGVEAAPCTITSLEATYPKIVQAGVPAVLRVRLLNGTSPVDCDKPLEVSTTDKADKGPIKATELGRTDGRVLFELALLHGPTQSVTVKFGKVTTTLSGIQVKSDSRSVEPGISTVVQPGPDKLVAIPTNNTVIDDAAQDGGISLGGKIYFFGSNGKGGKLYSYDPVEGVKQRSNTNPTGPDHQWVGGFRVVNGTIYFNAFSDKGCIKIYKYAPGDPLVTKPIDNINADDCDPIPDQIATEPDTDVGNGQTGSIPFNRGHDTPFPRYFAPIGLGTKVYFVASNGSRYDVYEYDQKKNTKAITKLPTPVTSPTELYLLGIDANQLVFAAPGGIYRYTPGGPAVTTPTTPGAAPVGIEVATGIVLDNVNYFERLGKLVRWTVGDAAPTMLSNTTGTDISDDVLDLGVIDGKVVFSALQPGSPEERRIFAYTPGGPAPVTTPLVDTCSSPCSEPATPVGMINGQFYFNGRDPSKGLKFYKTSWPASSNATATLAFTVNTAPMSYVFTSATLGDSVYFIAHQGFVGYLHSDKFPNYGFQRGNGRTGYGRNQLFVLPAGATTAQQVFDTVDVDIDGDDVATGSKYPGRLVATSSRMYFRARTDSVPENPEPEYGLFSHAPGEGMATVKINTDFRVPLFVEMIGIGDSLYFVGDVGAVGDSKFKLFRHVAGGGPLSAADAISDLEPGGSDSIRFLTDVGGVLFFRGGGADGNSKIYKWAPGDPPVLASDNRTDIVPGGDDAPVWNPKNVIGEDSSVINGKLFFTAADGNAYQISASSPVLHAGDALTGVQGSGDRVLLYQGNYYRAPFGTSVIDGIVYTSPGIHGVPLGYPITGSLTGTYFPRSRSGDLLKVCSLYGDPRLVANGVMYFWAYIPGTALCTYMATTPAHTAYPGYVVPFPALATSQTEFGTAGPAQGWRYDNASGWLFIRGGFSPVGPIHTAKSFAYRNGQLVLLSPTVVGNDDIPGVARAGTTSVFVNGDNCGGVLDWQTSKVEVNCTRLFRYKP